MKKFLLGTTALISLSAASAAMAGGSHAPAAAAPANTGGLTVMVGGKFNFQAVMTDQNETVLTSENNTAFRNDTTLNFTASGSSEDFDYGAVVEMIADHSKNNGGSAGDKNGDMGSRKSFLFVENDSFGRFEAGQNIGASSTMEVDASKIARATGGIDGDGLYGINTATTGTDDVFISLPNLPTGGEETNAGNANKITYYTPRFSGLQFGVSFTPDTGDRGSQSGLTSDIGSDYSNVFAGGLNFQSDVSEGLTLMASAVGEWGDAESATFGSAPVLNDLSAYSLGLGLEFEGFSIAGNWADLGDSGLTTTPAAGSPTDQTYWTLGAAYENGPYGVSVTYLDSKAGTGVAATTNTNSGENQLTNLVVGADYQMAPGLTPFVEASFFDFQSGSTTVSRDNDGHTVLVGAEVAF